MDKKAKNILFQTYWRNGCWVDQKNRRVDSADFLYAKNNGVMFDPLTISHDDCISHIVALSNKIPSDAVARTFLSSLSTRRLEWRSAVASWVCAKQIQPHIYTPVQSGHFYENGIIVRTSYTCGICMNLSCHSGGYESYKDKDLNILNFERIKWGGVRLGDLIYTLFDLEQFQKENISSPTETDILIFREILQVIDNSKPNDYPGALRDRFAQVKLLKSNKNELAGLIEILACIGVLQPASYDRPTTGRNDWHYAEFWRGEDKFNQETVQQLFGNFL